MCNRGEIKVGYGVRALLSLVSMDFAIATAVTAVAIPIPLVFLSLLVIGAALVAAVSFLRQINL